MAEVKPTGVLRKKTTKIDVTKQQQKALRDDCPEIVYGCVPKSNPLRTFFINLCFDDHAYFDNTIIFFIILNCVFLCIGDPVCFKHIDALLEANNLSPYSYGQLQTLLAGVNQTSATSLEKSWFADKCNDSTFSQFAATTYAELLFTIVFALEFLFKIIAMGFFWEKGSYLRDQWNYIDFVVVVSSFIAFIPGVTNLSMLRTFRVLRPLKALTSIKGMKTIVNSLLNSVSGLVVVFFLAMFIFFVFGIIGVQLWAGLFDARCYLKGFQNTTTGVWEHTNVTSLFTLDPYDEALCGLQHSSAPDCDAPGSMTTCLTPNGRVCGGAEFWNGGTTGVNGTGKVISFEAVCMRLPGVEPLDSAGFGKTDFDNIGAATITILTAITLEGWVDTMYNVFDSWGNTYITAFYFMSLVFFGSYFLLNLFLAVVYEEYENARLAQENIDRQNQLEAEKKAFGNLAAIAKTAIQQADAEKEAAAAELEAKKSPLHFLQPEMYTMQEWEDAGKIPGWYPYMNHLVTVCILLNTITMAMEYYGSPPTFNLVMSVFNLIFTIVFTAEVLLKWLVIGPRMYFFGEDNRMNIFDFVIVIFSLIEFIAACSAGDCLGEGGVASGISALRTFRLFRVFKLARSWKKFNEVIRKMIKCVQNVQNALVMLILVVFIFALVGMEFFAGKFRAPYFEEGDEPRAHFDTLFWSIITVFQILTGENWNEVLYNGMRVDVVTASIYFPVLFLVGMCAVFNLFLAVLLSEFDNPSEEEDEEDEEDEKADGNKASSSVSPEEVNTEDKSPPRERKMSTINAKPKPQYLLEGTTLFFFGPENPIRQMCYYMITPQPQKVATRRMLNKKDTKGEIVYNDAGDAIKELQDVTEWAMPETLFNKFVLFLILISSIMLAIEEPYLSTCKCWGEEFESKGISFSQYRTYSTYADGCRDLDYTYFKSFTDALYVANLIINVCFIIEMIVKIIAIGMRSYWTDAWNILDGGLVILSLVDMAGGPPSCGGAGSNIKALRALRAFRALRPLRAVRRFKGLRKVINAIFICIPDIVNVALIMVLFFLIFAIIGVQNFGGTVAACNDGSIDNPINCTGMFVLTETDCGMLPNPIKQQECMNSPNGTWFPREWSSLPANFDNVWHSLLTLYEISSGEMWPDIMYTVVDASGFDANKNFIPNAHEANQAVSLYFVMVQVVCSFMMLNVFVGVVLESYNQCKESGEELFAQREDIEFANTLIKSLGLQEHQHLQVQTKPPEENYRMMFYHFIDRRVYLFKRDKDTYYITFKFDDVIMGVIMLNTLFMALRHANQGVMMDNFLENSNTAFVIIFTVEAIIKLIALGPSQYFAQNWNRFDFFLVVVSFSKYIPAFSSFGGMMTLFRIIRIARMFRLVKNSPALMKMVRCLIQSLGTLWNIGVLFFLVMFIFTIFFMNLLPNIKHGENLGSYSHFGDFGIAFLNLFRMSTGESFNGIMHDAVVAPPYCEPDTWYENFTFGGQNISLSHPSNCGHTNSPWTQILFCLYFMLINFLLLNLIIAIILEIWLEDGAGGLQENHFDAFNTQWEMLELRGKDQKLIPKNSPDKRFIRLSALSGLLRKTPYPLGAHKCKFMAKINGKFRMLNDSEYVLYLKRALKVRVALLSDKTEVVPYKPLKKALTALATINGDQTTLHLSKKERIERFEKIKESLQRSKSIEYDDIPDHPDDSRLATVQEHSMALCIQILWQKHAQDVKFKLAQKKQSLGKKIQENVSIT